MSVQSLNGISGLLSGLAPKSTQQKNNAQLTSSNDSPTDVVSLSNTLTNAAREALLNTESGADSQASGSGDSLYMTLLGGSQVPWICGSDDVHIDGAENARLMKMNPALVKDIVSAVSQKRRK